MKINDINWSAILNPWGVIKDQNRALNDLERKLTEQKSANSYQLSIIDRLQRELKSCQEGKK